MTKETTMPPEETPNAPPETAPQPEEAAVPQTEEQIIQAGIAAMDAVDKAVEGGETAAADEKPAEGQPAEKPEVEVRDTDGSALPVDSPEAIRFAEQLAEVARRDRAVRQRQQEAKAEVEAMRQKLEAAERRETELKESLKNDPLGALQNFGVDFLKLLESGGGNDTPADPRLAQQLKDAMGRIDALESRLAEEKKAAEEQQRKQQAQATYDNALGRIHGVIAEAPEDYEAVLDHGQEGLARVFRALDAMFVELQERGLSPGPPSDYDIKQAAGIVEKVFRDAELADLRQKAERNRFKGRLTLGEPPTTTQQPAATNAASHSSKPPETLNNDLQATPPKKRELLTEEERIQAALAIPFPSEEPGGSG